MKQIISVLLILLLSPSGYSQEQDFSKIQAPAFREMPVFVGGHDDINTYRIPSVVCTSNGTVLVFCEGRLNNNTDGSPTHLY
jgi:sialidase-1